MAVPPVGEVAGLEAEIEVIEYRDGYGRLSGVGDPMEGFTAYQYDRNGNVISEQFTGNLGDRPGTVNHALLAETSYRYDALDRPALIERADFVPGTTERKSGSVIYIGRDGQELMRIVDPNGNETSYTYDSANRLSSIVDARGNTTAYDYDANGNIIGVTEIAKSDTGAPDQTFVRVFEYDGLNRIIASTDGAGNRTEYAYDARNNLLRRIDGRGNTFNYTYDFAGRLIQSSFPVSFEGPSLVTAQVWDANDRLIERTDANGTTTRYQYDPLDRLTGVLYADGTTESFTYDGRDNLLTSTDANGTVVTYTYDLLNRCTARTVVAGEGVAADTTFETYRYDGLSRLVSAANDSFSLAFTWDSLSNLTSERLNGQITASTYDSAGNRLSLTYPGGRSLTYTYDTLNRPDALFEGDDSLAQWSYLGLAVEARLNANGTLAEFEYSGASGTDQPADDFGFGQVRSLLHTTAAGAPVYSQVNRWDPEQNNSSRQSGNRRVGYAYDFAHRLTRATVMENGMIVRDTRYTLDLAGNRVGVAGGDHPGDYSMDPTLPDPADFQVNQYTTTPWDSRQYDANGNLVRAEGAVQARDYRYDYRDRLVGVSDGNSGEPIVLYGYDPLGRVAWKRRIDGSSAIQETTYFYDGYNAIEERQLGQVVTTIVFERSTPISMTREGGSYFFHTDDQGSVFALTDSAGNVVQRYDYDDYGTPTFMDGEGNPTGNPAVANPHLFQSERWESETGLYRTGIGFFDPVAGRHLSRLGSLRAHEAAHVVQQASGVSLRSAGGGKIIMDRDTGRFLVDPGALTDGERAGRKPGRKTYANITLKGGVGAGTVSEILHRAAGSNEPEYLPGAIRRSGPVKFDYAPAANRMTNATRSTLTPAELGSDGGGDGSADRVSGQKKWHCSNFRVGSGGGATDDFLNSRPYGRAHKWESIVFRR